MTRSRSTAGVTLLEMMIVLAVFSVVAVGVYEVVQHMTIANMHMSAQNEMTDWGDTAVNVMKDDVLQSRLVYENDATGNQYMAACSFPAGSLPLAGSTLPTIEELGTFVPDAAGAAKTGNILLFVRCLPAQNFTVSFAAPPYARSIDLYRFVAYYLSRAPAKPIGSRADSLVLMQWESVLYADYGQLNTLSTTAPSERADVIAQLLAAGVTHCWDFSRTADQAFFRLDPGTSTIVLPAENPHSIATSTSRKLVASLGLGFAGVAYNPTPTWQVPDRVPQYAIPSAALDGFPHGFEIQIIGPAGARQVMLRLVLAKFLPIGSRLGSQETVVIATSREF